MIPIVKTQTNSLFLHPTTECVFFFRFLISCQNDTTNSVGSFSLLFWRKKIKTSINFYSIIFQISFNLIARYIFNIAYNNKTEYFFSIYIEKVEKKRNVKYSKLCNISMYF